MEVFQNEGRGSVRSQTGKQQPRPGFSCTRNKHRTSAPVLAEVNKSYGGLFFLVRLGHRWAFSGFSGILLLVSGIFPVFKSFGIIRF